MAERTYKPGDAVMTHGVVCHDEEHGLYEVALACCANERVWIPTSHLAPVLSVEDQESLLRLVREVRDIKDDLDHDFTKDERGQLHHCTRDECSACRIIGAIDALSPHILARLNEENALNKADSRAGMLNEARSKLNSGPEDPAP